MGENYGKKTASGMIWKFGERFIAQMVSLVVSIILARILTPDDYSVVGIVTIFFTFSNVLITSGLNTALIQKKKSDPEDYSTVLSVSIAIAIVLYLILFLSAPLIADLYKQPLLIPIFRIMGIVLLINAVKSVLCAYISVRLEFKKFFFSTIGGTLVSAVIGITMAKHGMGAWALVAQQMTNSFIDTSILFLTTHYRISFKVVPERLKSLYSYGWKIFISDLINTVYDEINPLIIGLKYKPSDLSFYTKGRSFPSILNSSISDTFAAVLFPVMSKIQDDKQRLLQYTRMYIKVASYMIFPVLFGFFAVSDSFIAILLGKHWLPAADYIRIFCLSYMFNILTKGNLQVIKAIGRSDIHLILEIIKKVSFLIVIIAFLFVAKTPVFFAYASIVNSVIALLVNTYPNKKLIGYDIKTQLLDIMPNFIIALIMGVSIYMMNYIVINRIVLLCLQIVSGALIYLMISFVVKPEGFTKSFSIIKKTIKGDKNEE